MLTSTHPLQILTGEIQNKKDVNYFSTIPAKRNKPKELKIFAQYRHQWVRVNYHWKLTCVCVSFTPQVRTAD